MRGAMFFLSFFALTETPPRTASPEAARRILSGGGRVAGAVSADRLPPALTSLGRAEFCHTFASRLLGLWVGRHPAVITPGQGGRGSGTPPG
jgi:hypothetical protein